MKVDLKKAGKDSLDRYTKELTGLKEKEEDGELLQRLRGNINKVVTLPFKYLTIGDNVRQNFRPEDDEDFEDLVESIRTNGLLQNIVAGLIELDGGGWELRVTAGQRRYYACEKVGLEKVPVMIRQWNTEAEALFAGLSENMTRVDLNPLDIADAYTRLIQFGMTSAQIAERVDRQKRTIRKYLNLAKLPDDIRKLINDHRDIFTTGILFNEIASRTFNSTDELKNHIQGLIKAGDIHPESLGEAGSESGSSEDGIVRNKSKVRKKRMVDPALIEEVVGRISSTLPIKIKVKGTKDKGQITLNYASKEQLEQLLSKF